MTRFVDPPSRLWHFQNYYCIMEPGNLPGPGSPQSQTAYSKAWTPKQGGAHLPKPVPRRPPKRLGGRITTLTCSGSGSEPKPPSRTAPHSWVEGHSCALQIKAACGDLSERVAVGPHRVFGTHSLQQLAGCIALVRSLPTFAGMMAISKWKRHTQRQKRITGASIISHTIAANIKHHTA